MTTSETAPRLELEVQYACAGDELPDEVSLRTWTLAALDAVDVPVELVIRIVDAAESRELNRRYRGRDNPTNVLSFAFEAPPGVDCDHLGDLVICAPVVQQEAHEQRKQPYHHWAHMVVHGVLHLRGYDHIEARQAEVMEALEKQILASLGVPDPYTVHDMAV